MTNVKDAARGLSASVKKEKEEEQKKVVKDAAQTKVVVRRLPPTLTAETFVEQVSPLPQCDYFNFVPAGKSADKSVAYSRVYLRFVQYSDVFLFKEKFDGYEFIDSRGNVYPAVVEFAPYQRVPKRAKKPDPKMNSIDQDPDYKKFLEMLEKNDRPRVPTLQELLQQVEASKVAEAAVNSETPLLAFIKRKREEKKKQLEKQREERARELERKKAREDEERLRRRHQPEKEHQAAAIKDQRRQGSAASGASAAAANAATAAGDRAKKTAKDEEKEIDRQYDKPSGDSRRAAGEVRAPHSSGDNRWQKQGSQHPAQHPSQQQHHHHHQATSADKGAPPRPSSSSGQAVKSTAVKAATVSGSGETKPLHAAPTQYGGKPTASTSGGSGGGSSGGSSLNRPSSAKDRTAGENASAGSPAPGGKSAPIASTSAAERPASKDKPNNRRPADDYHQASAAARPSSARRSAAPTGASGGGGSKPAVGASSSSAVRKDVQAAAKPSQGSSTGTAARAGSEGASDASDTRHASGTEGSGTASERESRGSSEEAIAGYTSGARRSAGSTSSTHGVPRHGDEAGAHSVGAETVVTKGDDAGHEDKPRASMSAGARREFQQKTRYKERPERAIYDPALRAAERRQKQTVRGADGQASAADAKDS